MKLIGSLASPFVRKVRVVLAEKKLECQFELENVWAADTAPHNPCLDVAVFECGYQNMVTVRVPAPLVVNDIAVRDVRGPKKMARAGSTRAPQHCLKSRPCASCGGLRRPGP